MVYYHYKCPVCQGGATKHVNDRGDAYCVCVTCNKSTLECTCNPAAINTTEKVNHPAHYGGKDDPYEAIKVIEAWGLNFNLGNAIKYIKRYGKKDTDAGLVDLEKALWYLTRAVENLKKDTT